MLRLRSESQRNIDEAAQDAIKARQAEECERLEAVHRLSMQKEVDRRESLLPIVVSCYHENVLPSKRLKCLKPLENREILDVIAAIPAGLQNEAAITRNARQVLGKFVLHSWELL